MRATLEVAGLIGDVQRPVFCLSSVYVRFSDIRVTLHLARRLKSPVVHSCLYTPYRHTYTLVPIHTSTWYLYSYTFIRNLRACSLTFLHTPASICACGSYRLLLFFSVEDLQEFVLGIFKTDPRVRLEASLIFFFFLSLSRPSHLHSPGILLCSRCLCYISDSLFRCCLSPLRVAYLSLVPRGVPWLAC